IPSEPPKCTVRAATHTYRMIRSTDEAAVNNSDKRIRELRGQRHQFGVAGSLGFGKLFRRTPGEDDLRSTLAHNHPDAVGDSFRSPFTLGYHRASFLRAASCTSEIGATCSQ